MESHFAFSFSCPNAINPAATANGNIMLCLFGLDAVIAVLILPRRPLFRFHALIYDLFMLCVFIFPHNPCYLITVWQVTKKEALSRSS